MRSGWRTDYFGTPAVLVGVRQHMKATKYQGQLANALKSIYGEELVEVEWDSVQYDGHTSNHKSVYAPRIDIAVGPFNSYGHLDTGRDQTRSMQSHPFTKRLIDAYLEPRASLRKVWNSFARCQLAIEIAYSGSSKHILGDLVNACVSGSIGIVIGTEDNVEKIVRTCNYLRRLESLGRLNINALRNLIIFTDDEFLKLLSEFDGNVLRHN
jgi:hypothetical protein